MLDAQFGHPLKGQWSGEWGPKDKPNRLLLNFDWDGKDDHRRHQSRARTRPSVKSVVFDYTNPSAWGVKITAEGKDAAGTAGADHAWTASSRTSAPTCRHLHGTWTQGGQKGEFAVTRN